MKNMIQAILSADVTNDCEFRERFTSQLFGGTFRQV